MRLKGLGRRAIACTMVIAMLMSFCAAFTGCGVFNAIRNTVIDTSAAPVTEQELARLIIAGIQNKNSVSDSFSQIPEKQLDGISYSVFNEYVAILRSMSDKIGTVESFRILDQQSGDEYLDSILDKAGRSSFPDEYGDLSVVELDYGESRDIEMANHDCRFCISIDEKGTPYLSKKYVTDLISAYNYLGHYFTMLENSNTDGLFALLDPLYSDDVYINSVINAKVQYISEFYLLKVMSTRSEYIYDDISPLLVDVTIPKVVDEDGESITEHVVELSVNKNGSYKIVDNIPWYSDSATPDIYDSEGNAVRLSGVALNSARLKALLGEPYYIKPYELSEKEQVHYGKTLGVSAVYPGIVVSIIADPVEGGGWEGVVSSIRIYSNAYSLDGQITTGMNISELLLIYPMLDEADYTFTFTSGRDEYVVTFDFDANNNIRGISIARADLVTSR